MISNAKIRINLKEANENTEKSLTNPRKDWEIRIFKGFSINTAHGQSQLSQGKVRGLHTNIPKMIDLKSNNTIKKLEKYHQNMKIFI